MTSVSLRVLGCTGGWSAPGTACSGYVVTGPGTRIWIDAGSGTFAEFLRHETLDRLDAIWISHLHPDHCVDLTQVWQAVRYGAMRDEPLPVFGPPGLAEWLQGAVGDPIGVSVLDSGVFRVHQLAARGEYSIGDAQLTAVEVAHNPRTFGVRLQLAGRTLGYSGDTGPCAGLDDIAAGTDVFLCECYLSLPDSHCRPASTDVMTPEGAAEAARDGGARLLLLTHLHPAADPAYAAGRASRIYSGPIEVAETGLVRPV